MSDINNATVETGVDQLISYLKTKGKIDVTQAAKDIKATSSMVQSWAEFLMEEGIVGIEYKMTKPYIYLIENNTPENKQKEELKKLETKKEQETKKHEKKVYKWQDHLLERLETKKEFFYQQANIRNLENVDELWKEYKEKIKTY